ncbi:MAG: hypothetical protein DDG60_03400 [Anaerolineae bacterium]|nr:MAG: hypothetical protein DDG60_03400 [Anaerolineae bacterium]
MSDSQYQQDYPLLVAQGGPLRGERWAIDRPLVIGRERGCEVVIPDRQVSRFHARLTPSANGVVLEDLGSKNGTHYNGVPLLAPVVLQDGDTIHIAATQEFQFLSSDATMPLQAATPARTGRLLLDVRARQVWLNQTQLTPPLSAQQFQLLWTLYQNAGQVIAREALVSAVWGEEQAAGVTDQALDALLRRLRDRLAAIDPTHNYIVTVRGHGIMLDNEPGG